MGRDYAAEAEARSYAASAVRTAKQLALADRLCDACNERIPRGGTCATCAAHALEDEVIRAAREFAPTLRARGVACEACDGEAYERDTRFGARAPLTCPVCGGTGVQP